jgi:glycosyltransferase involved in cell wall biosynthesis
MKFCVVIGTHPDDTPGGAELQSQLLSAELASRSHECHYFAYASTQALPETVEGVHVHTRHNPTRRAILREIDDLDCDVYYFRNMADIPLAVYTDRLLSGSVIYNVSHDRQCRPLVALDHTVDTTLFEKVYANLREMFYRSLVPSLRNIVVQTRSQQRLLEQNRGIQAPIIGNGQRAPSRDFKKESPPVVLWLASIKDWKRPELFARLAERCNDLNATFRIVGRPSDQELAAEVRKKARQLDNLEYLGGCTISESDEYIGRASIFVNTSI